MVDGLGLAVTRWIECHVSLTLNCYFVLKRQISHDLNDKLQQYGSVYSVHAVSCKQVSTVSVDILPIMTGGVAGCNAGPVPGDVYTDSGSWYSAANKAHGSVVGDSASGCWAW